MKKWAVLSAVVLDARQRLDNSWVDWLIRRVDHMPAPPWLVYACSVAVAVVVLHGLAWTGGTLPLGILTFPMAIAAAWSVLCVAAIHYIEASARTALMRFRPAFQPDDATYTELLQAFTTTPGLPALGAFPLGALWMVALRQIDPTFFGLPTGNLRIEGVIYMIGWINISMIFLCTYKALRQLVTVWRAHQLPGQVDLFHRTPLFAFSKLTARIALLGAALSYLFFLAFPASMHNPFAYGYLLAINLPSLLAVFFVPLLGMHNRMVAEKERLNDHVSGRIRDAIGLLHAQMDQRTLAEADALNKLLSSLLQEEAYVRKIPTWPWEAGTVRGLLAAFLLPIVLFVVQRVLERLLSL
jgi:hypothetical protein